VEPHLTLPQINARTALKLWAYHHSPSIVGDSKIGGFQVLRELSEIGVTSTFSCSSAEMPWLWRFLKNDLPINAWKAATFNDGILVSVMSGEVDGASRVHQLISNFFSPVSTVEITDLNSNINSQTESISSENGSELDDFDDICQNQKNSTQYL